jgi:hypothetical protein
VKNEVTPGNLTKSGKPEWKYVMFELKPRRREE